MSHDREQRTGGSPGGRRHRGQTLLEVLVALSVLATVVVGATKLIDIYSQNTRSSVAAEQVSSFGDAASAYIRDNYAAVQAVATAANPALIQVSTLTATGYLSSGFSAKNPYQQTICALVLQPVAGQLNALVVTEGGTTINDLDLGQIAGIVGGAGGGVYSGSTGTLTGTMGGWSTAIGNFANANASGKHCDGSAGQVAIAAGHPVAALWFAGGDQTAGVLYRDAVPGQPSRNTMNTPIVMGASTIEVAGAACATDGAIARDAAGAVLSCQSSTWKAQGSLYWLDPVASFAALPGTDQVGAVRMTVDTGHAFMWTGAAWAPLGIDQNGSLTVPNWVSASGGNVVLTSAAGQGGYVYLRGANGQGVSLENNNGVLRILNNGWTNGVSVDQSGNLTADRRLTAGEYVQINGTAAAGGGCSPNGLVAKDGTGALLACKSGIWTSAGAPRAWSCNNTAGSWGSALTYQCLVYVPPTGNRLLLIASATVNNLCDGTGVGVYVSADGLGWVLARVSSTPNSYTNNDQGNLIAPSSWSGRYFYLYSYNGKGCSNFAQADMSIVEVQ